MARLSKAIIIPRSLTATLSKDISLFMIVFPAIDLKDGQCVRLLKGDMQAATLYNEDPASQALEFEKNGFSWLHLVDLNGAIEGRVVNHQAVASILKTVKIPVQLGGGLRNLEAIEFWLSCGLSRVILGTAALKDPALVKQACKLYPAKIAVGIDAKDGFVAVSGWVEDSQIKATDLVQHFADCGVACIIYTDIARDGTGLGLNMQETKELQQASPLPVIASGGVGSLEDLKAVKNANLHGVIVGRALYEQKLTAQECLYQQ
jgi:phosphoribosylformimino-5-aminoimidazole carboxamide ribotide isomerase